MFSWLKKMLEMVCDETGITLEDKNSWEISPLGVSTGFFIALKQLLPIGCVLYLEDPLHPQLLRFLAAHPAPCTVKVSVGSLWPRPTWYHVEANAENLDRIEELTEKNCAEPEICSSLVVYKDSQVLVSWHDAWSDPIGLSSFFSEPEVRDFSERLGLTYKRTRS